MEFHNTIKAARDTLNDVNPCRRGGVAKVIDFDPVFVTCLTCDVCYDSNGGPTYCQRGIPIDPRAISENMERAAKCKEWFPKVIGRRYSGAEYSEDTDKWYEKDSMG